MSIPASALSPLDGTALDGTGLDGTGLDGTGPDGTGPAASRAAPGGPGVGRRWPHWLLRAAALLIWQALTAWKVDLWVRFDEFPSPLRVAARLRQEAVTSQYYLDIAQSLLRILTGFALAAVAGVGLGILVARSRVAEDILQPLFEVARPIPAIALVPVAILLFPTNEQGIVFITFAAAFFPILVSTRHVAKALPAVWEDAVRTMGASRTRILRSVVLPGILPGVTGGLSVGMGVAWICVISAEMISGNFGVGYRTWQAYTVVDYPRVLVGMITIGVLGLLTSGAVELAGRRVTRWLPREPRRSR